MPLLNKEPFVRKKLNPKLSDSSEVFFCNATNEAFSDYDEFFERSILCSSMVWTCSVTGRSGLTFQEAAQSELDAITMISSFSTGLQRALLYLIKTVGSSKFNDIAYSVWAFATQRYFVEEEVEVVTNNGLIEARIVRVIPPNLESLTEEQSMNIAYGLDPSLYRYEIVPTKKGKLNFRMIVPADKVSRNLILTKDKVKLFLKQHVVCKKRLKITELKESSVRRYNLNGICWNDIYSGPLPDYDCSEVTMPKRKNVGQSSTGERNDRRKQTLPGQSCSSSGMNRGKPGPKPMSPEAKRLRMEEQKRQRAEAKRLERAKLREEKEKRDQEINQWKKKRDDLECDDLKPLPVAVCPISGDTDNGTGLIPVVSRIPESDFGDALMVLEFFNNFDEFFDLKEIFPHGFTFDLLEKALLNKSIDSPIGDLIRITLQTIFCLQEEEDKHDSGPVVDSKKETSSQDTNQDDEDGDKDEDNEDAKEDEVSVLMAKAKSSLINLKSLHGQTLSGLTINAYSITEVLRQHLLISGTPKPRSIYRGWFSSREDAGLALKLNNPEVLALLENSNIFDFESKDRLTILKTLMEQVSSFPAFRELVDVASDKLCELRKEIRSLQAEFSKWERENMIKRAYKRPESEEAGKVDAISEEQTEQEETFKIEREKKVQELNKTLESLRAKMRKQDAQHSIRPLGRDRAFRRYWSFNSIHGLFVETGEEHIGVCIEEGTCPSSSQNSQNYVPNGHSPTMSDKENEFKTKNFPSKTLSKYQSNNKLNYCSGSNDTCAVHGTNRITNDGTWSFFSEDDSLQHLISSLNSRGFRESELKDALEKDYETLKDTIAKCPTVKLNTNLPEEEVRKSHRLTTYKPGSKLSYVDKSPEEALSRTFADQLITLEEQLFSSGFSFRNPNVTITRDEWRKTLENSVPCAQDESFQACVKRLASSLSILASCILPNNLIVPLGTESGSLNKFLESLDDTTNISQLFIFLDTLDTSISWSKSALTAYCRICRKKKGADQMLLCDGCNRGYHTYCLAPPLESVPIGEWYCSECKPKSKIVSTPRKVPRTEPINYNESDSDAEEEEDMDVDGSSDAEKKSGKNLKSRFDEDDSDFSVTDEDDVIEEDGSQLGGSASSSANGEAPPCALCNEPDTDLECSTCSKRFHLKCHGSSNQRASRNSWTCSGCASRPPKIKLLSEPVDGSDLSSRSKRKRSAPKQVDGFLYDEKSMATAISKGIVPTTVSSMNVSKVSKNAKELVMKKLSFDDSDDFNCKHAQKIVTKLSKHDSSWPFHKLPKSKDAPDYEMVIKSHSDLTLINSKIKDGAYGCMNTFVSDIKKMFTNCEVYWPRASPEYRAGKELSKYFNQLLIDYGINHGATNGSSTMKLIPSDKLARNVNGVRETRSRNLPVK